MSKRRGNQSVAIEYLNNHVSQREVREVLMSWGVLEHKLRLIDWNKSSFPGREFERAFPLPLGEWPSSTKQGERRTR